MAHGETFIENGKAFVRIEAKCLGVHQAILLRKFADGQVTAELEDGRIEYLDGMGLPDFVNEGALLVVVEMEINRVHSLTIYGVNY
jgi:hypothetical protein